MLLHVTTNEPRVVASDKLRVTKEPRVVASNKLRVCHVLISALVAQSKPVESIKFALPILRDCGCNMKSPGMLATVSISSDPTLAAVMKTIDRLATSVFVGKPEFFPIVILRSLQMTWDHCRLPSRFCIYMSVGDPLHG